MTLQRYPVQPEKIALQEHHIIYEIRAEFAGKVGRRHDIATN
jgi:hypothetical protein